MFPTVCALIVALAGPPVLVVASRSLFGRSPELPIEVALQAVFCAFVPFILFIVTRVEQLPLTSIGLQRLRWSTLWSGILLAVAVTVLLPLITDPIVNALHPQRLQQDVARLAALPLWLRVVAGATSGIVEETLYRGYAIERLALLTGSRPGAGILAMSAFGLAHIPAWGTAFAMAADMPFGIVMTLFYLWKRDLAANALGHSLALVIGLVTLG